MRRYEILLPLRFNDGKSILPSYVGEVLVELRQTFDAASFDPQAIRGFWHHQGRVYQDDLVRVFVDVPDTVANRNWFIQFKERLKIRFKQAEIYLTTQPIEIL